MQLAATNLANIFQDSNYAWQLLNAQIQIEMSHLVSGDVIAYLLQLYMRGVERMNSLADPRESYFKNKVTSLMTKQTVIKSLKENPMKKKPKPHETTAKQQIKKKQSQKQSTDKTPVKKKKTKKQQPKESLPQPSPQLPTLNPLQLKQKRLQLQKRMAYVTQEHGPDSLKKIIAQEDHRQQNITSQISKIINSHEERLNERIKARKLRTATFRTKSEINIQEEQTPSNEYYLNQIIKQDERFTPFEQITLSEKKIQMNGENVNFENTKIKQKRYKSLETLKTFESPEKKVRKYTFDEVNMSKETVS